jgi:hypothetical protein
MVQIQTPEFWASSALTCPIAKSLEIPKFVSNLPPIFLEELSPQVPSLSLCFSLLILAESSSSSIVTSHLYHITSLFSLSSLAQTCPATTPISSCAASKLESHSEDSATSATANALSATPTYALPHSFASVTSAPLGTTRTSALSAAEKALATPFTALNVQDLRRIVTDAQRSSIWALQELICMFNPVHS